MLSSYNGKCEEGASKIARQRLLALPHMESPGDMVKKYAEECKSRLCGVFQQLAGSASKPTVVLAIDEAPGFIDQKFELAGSESANDWMARVAESLALMTVIHGVFPSCLIGTSFKMQKLVDQRFTYSGCRGKVSPFQHTYFVTKKDMWDTLRHYFSGLPETIPDSISKGLHKLEGRPLFFFDKVCTPLALIRLGYQWNHRSVGKH